MAIRRILKSNWLVGLVGFLGWALVFGVIYAQSPLYTNNQNAYFLHGLADAGFGYLKNDWLATRPESMPVFTWLVAGTYLLFHSKVPFYLYYALLMGVYLFCMYGIMDLLFDLHRSKARTLLFLSFFLAAHSAAMRYLLSRLVNSDATFLLEGGVANQRLLGQVFQPSVFGVLLILSVYLFLRKRPFWSLVPIAVAIYFHPVYLLAGALLTIGYMWVLFREERSPKCPLLLGSISLMLVAPALVYAILLFAAPSREVAQKALDILVNFRNPHHALVWAWLNWTVAVQAGVLAIGLFLVRKTRLFPILLIVTIGTVLLTLIQVATANEWLALIFPWRVSVILVPTGTTILIAFVVTKFMTALKSPAKIEAGVNAVSLVLIAGLMIVGAARFQIESARQLADPARAMMNYVAAHKSPGDVYMVPSKMDDFRLVTGAPIFVDFKSAPDRDEDVLVWYDRIQAINWFYNGAHDPCQTLLDMAAKYGITHAVVERSNAFTVCPKMPVAYDDAYYRVYKITSQP